PATRGRTGDPSAAGAVGADGASCRSRHCRLTPVALHWPDRRAGANAYLSAAVGAVRPLGCAGGDYLYDRPGCIDASGATWAGRCAGGHLEARVKGDGGGFIRRVGMAFNAVAAQVQGLLRSQQEMIRAVSHELRTPVARIRFGMQMVEDMSDDPAVHRQLNGI